MVFITAPTSRRCDSMSTLRFIHFGATMIMMNTHVESRPATLSRIVQWFAVLALLVLNGVASQNCAADHLSVSGRFLKTPCGDTIILRGLNKMCVFESDRWGIGMMPDIKKTGSNVLRIVWTTSDKAWMVDTLDAVIQACIDNAMIPMVELHDATGDFSKLSDVAAYWLSEPMLALIKKHERYLMCNIANEAGDFDINDDTFTKTYSYIVQTFRMKGVHVPLVIDASGYGQNIDVLLNSAASIIAADPDKNLMFSLHAYWAPKYFPNPAELLHNKLAAAVAKDIPLIIGEFTGCYLDDPNSSDDLWKTILPECKNHRLGWIAWEWGPGNADYSTNPPTPYTKMDMSADGTFDKIQDGWARTVLLDDPNSIAKSAVTPEYIKLKGNCPSSDVNESTLIADGIHYHNGLVQNIASNDVHVLILSLEGRIVLRRMLPAGAALSIQDLPSACYQLVWEAQGLRYSRSILHLR